MSVKIIRPYETIDYSVEIRRVYIEFLDGSHMIGQINIHSKFAGSIREDEDYSSQQKPDELKLQFHRTSDYLRHCSEHEGMITVFDASYGGLENKLCFVFLHSVKFISEEKDIKPAAEERPGPAPEEPTPPRTGLSLRDRLKRNE